MPVKKPRTSQGIQTHQYPTVCLLTLLCAAASSLLQRVLPVVQLHTKGAAQRGGGLGVGHLHHVDMTVCRAEVAAVEGGHLRFGLLKGGPRSVLQHPSKLPKKEEKERYR